MEDFSIIAKIGTTFGLCLHTEEIMLLRINARTTFGALITSIVASALLLVNAGCQNNSASSAQPTPANPYGNYATTPQPCNYMQPNYNGAYNNYPYNQPGYNTYPYNNTGYNSNCAGYNVNTPYYNQNWYQPNWNYGQWIWPTQWAPNYGSCGCPSGYRPVMSQYYGMSCAPNAYFYNYSVVWYNWGYFAGQYQNMQWLNSPQVAYSNTANCGQIAQGCDVRMNNCPSGLFCQAVGGGSTIGICTR